MIYFLYFTHLLYTLMYACILCARLAPLLLLSIFWIIISFHVPYWCITVIALTNVTLFFIFGNVTLMICMVMLACSFDFIDFLHLTLICVDDIYDKYYVWPLTFDWRQFWWVHLQFTSGHEFGVCLRLGSLYVWSWSCFEFISGVTLCHEFT